MIFRGSIQIVFIVPAFEGFDVNILFYSPMKPIGHPNPSGDQTTAIELVSFLRSCGHRVKVASNLRGRWIYWKPWFFPKMISDIRRIQRNHIACKPDLFLTHHSYYKAPDIIGPSVCRRFKIPYVVFQGIYSTKQRRNPKTWLGYVINRRALLFARHIFANRLIDLANLKRIILSSRLSYIQPGIDPRAFPFSKQERMALRSILGVAEDMTVIVSAAMLRPGVKAAGIDWMIHTSMRLLARGHRHVLLIAGDGAESNRLKALAQGSGSIVFLGKVPRERMFAVYSSGDIFAFPGIRESLGMVYLEAQSCGLPVVAFDNGGIGEVVRSGETGFLTPPFDLEAFDSALVRLLCDAKLRREMGNAGAVSVRSHHDAGMNFRHIETILLSCAGQHRDSIARTGVGSIGW